MDRGVRDRIVKGRAGKGTAALVLLALLAVGAGCNRYAAMPPPMPSPASEDLEAARTEAGEGRDASRVSGAPAAVPGAAPSRRGGQRGGKGRRCPAGRQRGGRQDGGGKRGGRHQGGRWHGGCRPGCERAAGGEGGTRRPPFARQRAVRRPASESQAEAGRRCASGPGGCGEGPPQRLSSGVDETGRGAGLPDLVRRHHQGYARFRYDGKVSIAGKAAYHLNVRAWTSGSLSFVYRSTIRIDYTRRGDARPDRAGVHARGEGEGRRGPLNQETGRITYRYRQSGKIRKQVDTVPSVYDPVSVAYYFRWRDLGVENRPRNMYGGRKLYQISSRVLGTSGSGRITGRWTRSRSSR